MNFVLNCFVTLIKTEANSASFSPKEICCFLTFPSLKVRIYNFFTLKGLSDEKKQSCVFKIIFYGFGFGFSLKFRSGFGSGLFTKNI
jgi:hypothetical protein